MPILNGMEILEEKLGDSVGKYRREIDIITRNASRLQNHAESILQVSRIDSGTFSLSVQSGVDIHSLIAQVIDDVEKKYAYTDKAGKGSIVFLPLYDNSKKYANSNSNSNNPHFNPLYVDCESQKIAQVIFNLLDNAMKFTFDGKVFVSTNTTVISGSQPDVTNRNSTGNHKDITTGEGKPPTQPDSDLESFFWCYLRFFHNFYFCRHQ